MALVPFSQLMADAERGGYAVGYFESWNLESLLAVADAAEALHAPVILGFSGIYLPHPDRRVSDPLGVLAAMAAEVGRRLRVPCCLLFNESPYLDWVQRAIELGFQLVMYTPDGGAVGERVRQVRGVVERAHARGAAVEGEIAPPPGLAGGLSEEPAERSLGAAGKKGDSPLVLGGQSPFFPAALTDPAEARRFVADTGVDALAVNVGQAHLHGRRTVRLDLDRLGELHRAVDVPLVLHGASSVATEDLRAAVARGVRKINVGSVLKQAYLQAVGAACEAQRHYANPYEVVGSGLEPDVLVAGRLAVQKVVEEYLRVFGSAGQAGRGA
jgi:fructose/tagatose bisphosphate aldolase